MSTQVKQNSKVSLFIPCLVDQVLPEIGLAMADLLRKLGYEISYNPRQTCCGQPAFNSGYRDEARQVARHFIEVFRQAEVIVTPSGSCAAMVRHEYPALFASEPVLKAEAERLASITWEFSEFIVDGLGISDLGARLPERQTAVCHHACHGLRLLNLKSAAEMLLDNTENLSRKEWDNSEICCGFGGLFAVKMADVSGAMLHKKLEQIADSGADCVVTGDISCLMHMNGGLQKQGQQPRVRHIADVLADAIRDK